VASTLTGHGVCVYAEQSKVALMCEIDQHATSSDHVQTLQSSLDSVTAELADVSSKLQEAAVQLSKEKARNNSVVEHSSVSHSLLHVFLRRFVFNLLGEQSRVL